MPKSRKLIVSGVSRCDVWCMLTGTPGKHALTSHPDKNMGDPQAEEKVRMGPHQ